MNRVKICEIMELVGILRKKRMKKAPLPKVTGPVGANWWEDRSTVNATLHETISNDDF